MVLKLFNDDNEEEEQGLSKIEIDESFASRYEYNKKREDLQRYEELKKKGIIESSDSETESEEEDDDDTDVEIPDKKKDVEFFNNLIKIKNRDPSIYGATSLFESESSDDGNGSETSGGGGSGDGKQNSELQKVKKSMFLKDVIAQQLVDNGPEWIDEEGEPHKNVKTYKDEERQLQEEFMDAMKKAEEDAEEDLMQVKNKRKEGGEDEDGGDDELVKKLGEYFGDDYELDENKKFLKDFFLNKMWIGHEKENGSSTDEEEVEEALRDEEEVLRQDEYEEKFNFRHEENVGDRVLGYSRSVIGSVRKKKNPRKEQRKRKEERMRIAEAERREELKHLKNVKKEEVKNRLKLVMEAAGISEDNSFPLGYKDLETEYDPEEYDKMMNNAFPEKYYECSDADIERPDFGGEDEALGLPKGWDLDKSRNGFTQATERASELDNGDNDDDDQKQSMVRKAKAHMMDEYYKLDYEDRIGDLETRFKYTKVNPKRYGLRTEHILMLDDKQLNQYVPVKKLAPYREKEWKVPYTRRNDYRMKIKEILQGKSNDSKAKTKNGDGGGGGGGDGGGGGRKEEVGEANGDGSSLSKKAKRKRREAHLKLSASRLTAYGKIQPKGIKTKRRK